MSIVESGDKTNEMRELKIHGIYKHYKGDLYIVEDIATHSETGEKLVIYRGLYGGSPLYARPLTMFLDKHDGEHYRFELREIESVRTPKVVNYE
jgi:hypothetical protein